jgi:hypothetical protein
VWAGAVSLILAEGYAAQGCPVEVHAIWSTSTRREYGYDADYDQGLMDVIVKEAHQDLVPDLLAAVVANPRTFRFAMLTHLETMISNVTPGYGVAQAYLTPSDLEALDMTDAIVVNACYGYDQAVQELQKLSNPQE